MLLGYAKGKKKITAPVKHDPGKGYDTEYLAYLTLAEMEMMRRKTDGTVSRGPRGIPSFVDADMGGGNYNSGYGNAAPQGPTGPRDPTGPKGAISGGSGAGPVGGGNQGSQRAGGTNNGAQRNGPTGGTNNGAMGGLNAGLRGPTGPQGQAKSQAQMQGLNQTAAAMASAAAKGQLGQPQGAFGGGGKGAFGKIAGGLRGATGPMGEPRTQPANYGTNYQTAQMMRSAYPGVAARTSQTQLANALNTFSRAMPGEAGINMFGTGAMNNIGRVGLNQIVGGFSPEKMLRGMDTTGMRPATRGFDKPGPNSMGMVPVGSPQQTMASVALRESLTGAGVSPTAMNASNFVAAGTPMVRGVNPVGQPIAGTQFGHDPTWGNRIQMANLAAADKFSIGSQPSASVQIASLSPAVPSRSTITTPQQQSLIDRISAQPAPRSIYDNAPPPSRPVSGMPAIDAGVMQQSVAPFTDMGVLRSMMQPKPTAPQWNDTGRINANALGLGDKVVSVELSPADMAAQYAQYRTPPAAKAINDRLVTQAQPATYTPSKKDQSRLLSYEPVNSASYFGGIPSYTGSKPPAPQPSRQPSYFGDIPSYSTPMASDITSRPLPAAKPAGPPVNLVPPSQSYFGDIPKYAGSSPRMAPATDFAGTVPGPYNAIQPTGQVMPQTGEPIHAVTNQMIAGKIIAGLKADPAKMAQLSALGVRIDNGVITAPASALPALEAIYSGAVKTAGLSMFAPGFDKIHGIDPVKTEVRQSALRSIPGQPGMTAPQPVQMAQASMPMAMPGAIRGDLATAVSNAIRDVRANEAKPHLGTPASQTAQNAPQGGAFQNVAYTPSEPKSPPAVKSAVARGLLGGNMQVDPGDRGSKRKKRRRRGAFQQVIA